MTLQLGDTAPDFTAQTTEGELRFHEHLGDGWGILFSHPADFTPVCTTELGEFARRKKEFDDRSTRIVGVSVVSRLYEGITAITDLDDAFLTNLQQFWVNYNDLKGRSFEVTDVRGAKRACRLIERQSV